ncbi:ligand-dependent nuclear receptor-interacting factor 1 isoform 2-T2 [Discoglossus pictus]
MYQVVQGNSQQGKNILQLIPVSKSADNLIPLSYPPVISSSSNINAQKQVSFSLPPPLPNTILPSPINVLQQPSFGNYIITTQRNPIEGTKSISVVDNKTSPLQNTTVILEKSHVNVASQPPRPTFMMVNQSPVSSGIRTMPTLPSGHHLQIPANAEVKSVPASSLPIAIQQKILAASTTSGKQDISSNPSVIYVSPVNTVKTVSKNLTSAYLKPNTSIKDPAIISSSLAKPSSKDPAVFSSPIVKPLIEHPTSDTAQSPKMPMKWIVQENKESASCLVPVKSSNDTASKILKILSGTKNESSMANVLPMCSNSVKSNSNVIPIKDNALVMYNNKIYLLAKRGSEVFKTETKKPELPSYVPPEKPLANSEAQIHSDSMKDISNKVVEVVLSKNKVSKPSNPLMGSTTESPLLPIVSNVKKERSAVPHTLPQSSSSQVDEDDDVIFVSDTVNKGHPVFSKPQVQVGSVNTLKTATPSTIATNTLQEYPISQNKPTMTTSSSKPDDVLKVTKMSIKDMRLKFGLLKKEKVLLRRLPLLNSENRKSNPSPTNYAVAGNGGFNMMGSLQSEVPIDVQQHPVKRKSTDLDIVEASVKRKTASSPSQNALSMSISLSEETQKNPPTAITCLSPLSSTPLERISSSSLATNSLPQENVTCNPSIVMNTPPVKATHPHPDITTFRPMLPDHYETGPSSTAYIQNHTFENSSNYGSVQSGHHSSFTPRTISPTTRRVYSEFPSPVDLDETVRDEKIRRLKELLREREQALEAIRSQMNT